MSKSATPLKSDIQASQIPTKNDKKVENQQKSTPHIETCQALDLSIHSKKTIKQKSDFASFNSVSCKRESTKNSLKVFPVNNMTSQPNSCLNANIKRQKETQSLHETMRQEHAPFIRLHSLPQRQDNENRPKVLGLPNYPINFAPSPIADLQVLKSSSPFSIPSPSSSPLSTHSAASTDEVLDWKVQQHLINIHSSHGK